MEGASGEEGEEEEEEEDEEDEEEEEARVPKGPGDGKILRPPPRLIAASAGQVLRVCLVSLLRRYQGAIKALFLCEFSLAAHVLTCFTSC